MEEKELKALFGLIGRNISYSFSKTYFTKKFNALNLSNYEYVNFDLKNIEELQLVLKKNKKKLRGMNVTIPYKEEIIPFLDKIDNEAQKIGAVNTIRITKKGKLKGYNTDYAGFKKSLQPLLKEEYKKALILGTGGASKAIAYALKKLNIPYIFVSRETTNKKMLKYQNLKKDIMQEHLLIVNCTPLGTHPNIQNKPTIPYEYITNRHILYDLIYNPPETEFLKSGKEKEATIKNGLEMLEIQAEEAWKIWQK